MRTFLEEYGITLFVIACISALVFMAEPVGDAVETAVLKAINTFTQSALSG